MAGEQRNDDLDIEKMTDSVVDDLLGTSDEDDTQGVTGSLQNQNDEGVVGGDPEEGKVKGTISKPAAPAEDNSPAPEFEAPKSVPSELAAKWKDVPGEFREWYAKREKDFLDGTEQYRRAASFGQDLHEVINPYLPYIQSRTYSDGRPVPVKDAIGYLLNAEYQLQTGSPQQKAAMFAKMAKDYGVDLTTLAQSAESSVDPAVLPFVQKVEALENTLSSWQQQQMRASREAAMKEVQAFAADKVAHPYFDELADDIAAYCSQGLNLADAYERAVWANPATRAKEQARLDKERSEKAKVEAEDRRKKALRLQRQNVRPTATDRRPTAPTETMEDTLRDKYREIQSRES